MQSNYNSTLAVATPCAYQKKKQTDHAGCTKRGFMNCPRLRETINRTMKMQIAMLDKAPSRTPYPRELCIAAETFAVPNLSEPSQCSESEAVPREA